MADRSKDWFAQAERDLEQAKASQKEERHEWACFAAHQSAEKAVKALHLSLKQEAWGRMDIFPTGLTLKHNIKSSFLIRRSSFVIRPVSPTPRIRQVIFNAHKQDFRGARQALFLIVKF